MNFEQYAESQRKKAFGPSKKYTMRTAEEAPIPHEPGTLSQQGLGERASTNESRGSRGGATGEVVGEDLASGESLVRTPGNRLVRVSTGQQAVPGQQVSVRSNDKTDEYARIRREGSVVSTTLTSSSGWARADNATNGFRGTSSTGFSVTREVKDAGLLGDACTPPDVRLRILGDAINNGVYLNERGDIVGGAARGLLRGWGDQLAGFDALGKAYKEAKQAKKQEQSLPSYLSLDELGGQPRLDQQFQPGVPLFWKCLNGTCVQAEDGVFPTKDLCQAECSLSSYSCVNGTCVEIPGLTGQFKTQAECLTSGCSTRYTCVSGECVPSKGGEFPTLASCQASGCYWGFNCVGGNCEPAVGGTFKTLACCQQTCEPLGPGLAYYSSISTSAVEVSETTVDGVTGSAPAWDPELLSNEIIYSKHKKNFDPNQPLNISWLGESNTPQTVLLVLNERAKHSFTIHSLSIDRETPGASTDIDFVLWVNHYLPGVSAAGAAISTTLLGINDRSGAVQGYATSDFQTQQLYNFRQFLDERATYVNAVAAIDAQVAASTRFDSLMIPFSGIFYGESTYAEVGWRLRAQTSTPATVTQINTNLWRYTWTDVTFSSNPTVPGNEILQNAGYQTRPFQPWLGADTGFCQDAIFTNSSTGLSAPRSLFNPFLVLPSPFWPEDWSAYSLDIIPSTAAAAVSLSLVRVGDPPDTQDFFTDYTHPSTVGTFYPWANLRNGLVWTDPKYSSDSVDGAAITGCP